MTFPKICHPEHSEGSIIRHASSPCKVCEQILHYVQDDKKGSPQAIDAITARTCQGK